MSETNKPKVTVIPATMDMRQNSLLDVGRKRRTAAYARVSTDNEEQLTSYEAQVDYFTQYIKNNPEYEFIAVYTDEGISATSTKKREGFRRMITDALNGKLDLIITKSVSRFARNTVDTLTTVRQLKEKGVEVYFQKENIYTLDSKGELLITIMSSLAQEESRSISENVKWGVRKRFADGKVSLPYKRFLGYEKGSDGLPSIVEDEADIVRIIYRLFLYGKSPNYIASALTEAGFPTPGGKAKWRPNVIISILTNEKFRGDAKLQKRFTEDFLTKKQRINNGEIPMWHVQNSHPAIIDAEMFDLVQYEMQLRKSTKRWSNGAHPFSGKVFCRCGRPFGPKTWHSTDAYRRTVWQCNDKYTAGGAPCPSPHLTEEQMKVAFLTAFNARLNNKAEIFEAYDEVLRILTDNSILDAEAAELQSECDVVTGLVKKIVQENASAPLDQNDYNARYNALIQRYETATTRLTEIDSERLERNAKRANITRFLKILMKQDELITEFDDELWYTTVDSITVFPDGKLKVTFRDGSDVEIAPEIWKAA